MVSFHPMNVHKDGKPRTAGEMYFIAKLRVSPHDTPWHFYAAFLQSDDPPEALSDNHPSKGSKCLPPLDAEAP